MALPEAVTLQPLQAPRAQAAGVTASLRNPAGRSRNYTTGTAAGFLLAYPFVDSFAWFVSPSIDDPVVVRLSESLGGVFVDARIEITYLPMVDHPLGELHGIGTELDPGTLLYTGTIASRRESGALITYEIETLVAQLNRVPATIPVQLLPGDGGMPTPLTPTAALEAILQAYGIPHQPVPPLLIRAAGVDLELDLAAFVYQPEPENPITVLELLEQFLQPFRGYATRASNDNELQVTAPYWATPRVSIDTVTIEHDDEPYVSDELPWPADLGDEWPVLRITLSAEPLDETPEWEVPLTPNVEAMRDRVVQGILYRIRATYDPSTRTIAILAAFLGPAWPTDEFTITTTRRGDLERLQLYDHDLGLHTETYESSDGVVNAAEVTIQGWTFEEGQPLLALAGVLLRAGASSWSMWYGTLNLPAKATPADLSDGAAIELLNETPPAAGLVSKAFGQNPHVRREVLWSIDEAATIQPGSSITIDYTLNIDCTYHGADGLADLATQQITGVVTVPQNGQQVTVWSGEYARHASETSIGERGRGRVLAEYRSTDRSILVTVEHQPYGHGWYSPAFLSVAEVFYMHAIEVLVLGSGRIWTRDPNATVVRFGYTQADRDAVPGLGESQARYQLREDRLHLGWFDVDAASALAIARGRVEHGYNPRREYRLTIEPNAILAAGYRLPPPRVGTAALLPGGILGTMTEGTYQEAHTPASSRSLVDATITAEEILAAPRAARRHYGRAKYGLSRYQLED